MVFIIFYLFIQKAKRAKRPRVGSIRVNILVETKYDLGPEQEDFDWAMDPVEDSGFPPGQGSGHWL